MRACSSHLQLDVADPHLEPLALPVHPDDGRGESGAELQLADRLPRQATVRRHHRLDQEPLQHGGGRAEAVMSPSPTTGLCQWPPGEAHPHVQAVVFELVDLVRLRHHAGDLAQASDAV